MSLVVFKRQLILNFIAAFDSPSHLQGYHEVVRAAQWFSERSTLIKEYSNSYHRYTLSICIDAG